MERTLLGNIWKPDLTLGDSADLWGPLTMRLGNDAFRTLPPPKDKNKACACHRGYRARTIGTTHTMWNTDIHWGGGDHP